MAKRKFDLMQLKDLYENKKLSTIHIARILGGSKAGIRRALLEVGVILRDNGGSRVESTLGFVPTKEFIIAAMTYFNQVASDAAKHYQIPYATWIDLMKRFDIPRQRPGKVLIGRPSHRRQEIPLEEASLLSDNGATYEELAKKYSVSYGVISRRFKEAGYKAPFHRAKDPRFKTAQWHKRKVLKELNLSACEICGEHRALDLCHIKPAAQGGPITKNNCLVLCPLHHRLYDSESLEPSEFARIQPKINQAMSLYGTWV